MALISDRSRKGPVLTEAQTIATEAVALGSQGNGDLLVGVVAPYRTHGSDACPLITAFATPMAGLWLLRQAFAPTIWPVRRWGYLFYPGHLAALQLIRMVL